ncbi:PREDICTED: estradiol 17-beta-dehydrogenase 11-like [Ceratosolen solmsi marchali]|uniref:Short-chain dehydrogenase/reductase 3 n=1 Tax=Ceratosolen solmsi marchali TaxID=326594 RepID=A0AAJ6YDI6_9HYME|nr:PREDICTED: estradiol 17-beta-dehydrogenase 11-like [Ceratosolen solmsi marchali]
MYLSTNVIRVVSCHALVIFAVMTVSTPQAMTLSSTNHRQRRRCCNFLGTLLRIPSNACSLFLLLMRCTMAMLTASIRLVVPPWKKSLFGETVLITGAGHGIGRELAIQLSALGCIVVCWDTDIEANRATMSIISKNGGEVHGFVVDVSKRLEVREVVRLMRKADIPDVNILINNTGVLLRGPFLDYKDEDVQKIFEINVLSQFWTIQAFLPSMLRNKKGHIVSINNMCEFNGLTNNVAYCSSKFAVRGLMESLCEELRLTTENSKINFTTVYPLYLDTDFHYNPKFRFPYLSGVASPTYTAKKIIRAIQRNYEEYSIPGCLVYLSAINRLLPRKAMRLIIDFLTNFEKDTTIAAD